MEATRRKPKARHPDLDVMFAKHRGLIYKTAQEAAVRFGGRPEDYLGSLLIRLNICLYRYDPAKGAFTTYFQSHWDTELWQTFLRHESESRSARYRHKYRRQRFPDERQVLVFNEASLPEGKTINTHAAPGRDASEIADGRLATELLRLLPERLAFVLEQSCRGLIYADIGKLLGISRERVRQLRNKALARIRRASDKVTAMRR